MLAVGLLGFAVAWVLAGQDRRLRTLEQQISERSPMDDTDRSFS